MSSEASDESSDSDLDIKKIALPKKKTPVSPTDGLFVRSDKTKQTKPKDIDHNAVKKITTRDMIRNALTDLKTRKGVSLYAVKKYMVEKYEVDTQKINYLIKKNIKAGIEDGTIIQTKGVGAAGSFKLAPGKKAEEKKTKPKLKPKPSKEKLDKPTKPKNPDKKEKSKKDERKTKKEGAGVKKTAKKETTEKVAAKSKQKPEKLETKTTKEKKKITSKMAKPDNPKNKTPAKKRVGIVKRKSIGSIIKKPKMKPRSIKGKD